MLIPLYGSCPIAGENLPEELYVGLCFSYSFDAHSDPACCGHLGLRDFFRDRAHLYPQIKAAIQRYENIRRASLAAGAGPIPLDVLTSLNAQHSAALNDPSTSGDSNTNLNVVLSARNIGHMSGVSGTGSRGSTSRGAGGVQNLKGNANAGSNSRRMAMDVRAQEETDENEYRDAEEYDDGTLDQGSDQEGHNYERGGERYRPEGSVDDAEYAVS